MFQLPLAIDRDSQLLNQLIDIILSPLLSNPAKSAEVRRLLSELGVDLADLAITPAWSASELAKELGVSAQFIGRLANQHGLKTNEFGEYRLTHAAHSPNKQVQTFHYNLHGRHRLAELMQMRTNHAYRRTAQRADSPPHKKRHPSG